jgi:hypothetical protein
VGAVIIRGSLTNKARLCQSAGKHVPEIELINRSSTVGADHCSLTKFTAIFVILKVTRWLRDFIVNTGRCASTSVGLDRTAISFVLIR